MSGGSYAERRKAAIFVVRFLAFPVALLVFGSLVGCSGSDSNDGSSGTGGGGASNPAYSAFGDYCIGTLKVERNLELPGQTGGWVGDGSKASAGTKMLVATDFGRWGGYVFQADGTPALVVATDYQTGLVRDTDFSAACATDVKLNLDMTVTLDDTIVFPNADYSGDSCTLPMGTLLTNYSIAGSATLSGDEIQAACGFAPGYAQTIHYGSLIPK